MICHSLTCSDYRWTLVYGVVDVSTHHKTLRFVVSKSKKSSAGSRQLPVLRNPLEFED